MTRAPATDARVRLALRVRLQAVQAGGRSQERDPTKHLATLIGVVGPTATPAATPTPTTMPSPTSAAGQMTHAHSTHTATALADGRVLVAGFDGVGVKASAELQPSSLAAGS